MKNISRRVFIKGLAVAGVAAAASTVLAGCNTDMIPGVGDDTEGDVTEPAASNEFTFTDPDASSKTLTVTGRDLVLGSKLFGNEDSAVVTVLVNNKLVASSAKTYFVTTDPDDTGTSLSPNIAKDGYYVLVSAYADGNDARTISVTANSGLTATAGISAGSAEQKLTLDLEDVGVKSSVTVKFEVKKVLNAAQNKGAFKTIQTEEFTYNV